MSRAHIRVGPEDFDLSAEVAALSAGRRDIGAVASFTGLAREIAPGDETPLELEHYPGMTEKALLDIAEEAVARWTLTAARVVHRVGAIPPGGQIVLVACAARHRGDAFAAAEFIMDYLKTRAPFWKREGEAWVEARESDDAAARRWAEQA